MIDWKQTQRNIGADPDGNPGRETYGRLMAKAAQRPYDDTMKRLGDAAAKFWPQYEINRYIRRIAGTIANTSHETGGYRLWEENLSYSAAGLAKTWPSRFAIDSRAYLKKPNDRAIAIARKPQLIAAATYGLRMGNKSAQNDNDENEDGWQYRGRGIPMLTGKELYAEYAALTGLDLIRFPDLASDPYSSMLIACAFMEKKGILAAMDDGNAIRERTLWNGGLIGFDDIQIIRNRVLTLIAAK